MNDKNLARAFCFYAVTIAFAVAVSFAVPLIDRWSLILTMMTPAAAVAIMFIFVAREGSFRSFLGRLGLDHAGLKGWPVAIIAPAAIHSFGFLILLATGITAFSATELGGTVPSAIFNISSGLVVGTLFGLGEEIGWRGYMLPHLLRLGVVPAMLIVGFLHGVWHLPLMLTTDYYHNQGNPLLVVPLFLATLTLVGVFYGFLRIWTGSVWPVAIAHSAANMAWEVMNEITQTKSPIVLEYIGGESGLIMIGGLLIMSFVFVRHLKSSGFTSAITHPVA